MGYASYVLADGREAGYAVDAICDDKDCTAKIDRGFYYLCGRMPGGDEHGCGGYFCGEHLFHMAGHDLPQLCEPCADRALADAAEGGG
jgi:hypothetical protein